MDVYGVLGCTGRYTDMALHLLNLGRLAEESFVRDCRAQASIDGIVDHWQMLRDHHGTINREDGILVHRCSMYGRSQPTSS